MRLPKKYRALRDRMVIDLGAEEGVDKKMIDESIANYLIPEVEYAGKVCLDLGANVGAFSKIALDQGAKKVIVVECDPRNISILENNALSKYKKHVEIIPAAVSMFKTKTVKLFKADNDNKHCSTTILNKNTRFKEYEEVRNVNYDSLIKKYNPSIVKIDIEAAEHHMMDNIINSYPDVLFIEVHGGKYKNLLEPTVERLRQLYPISKIEPLIVFGDVLAYDCFFMKDNLNEESED